MKPWMCLFTATVLTSCLCCTHFSTADWRRSHDDEPARLIASAGSGRVAVLRGTHLLLLSSTSGATEADYDVADSSYSVLTCTATICAVGGGLHESGLFATVELATGSVRKPVNTVPFAEIYGISIVDDRTIATAHGDESVVVWDASTLTPTRRLSRRGGLEVYAVYGHMGRLLIGNDRGEVVEWGAAGDQPIAVAELKEPVLSLARNQDTVVAAVRKTAFLLNEGLETTRTIGTRGAIVVGCAQDVSTSELYCGLSDSSVLLIRAGDSSRSKAGTSEEVVSLTKNKDRVVAVTRRGEVVAWSIGGAE